MRGMVVDACMEARTPGTLPHTLRTFGVHFVSNNLTRPTSGIACPALSAAALHHMLFAAASEQTAAGAYLPRPCMTLAIEALMPPCGGHACSPFRSCSRAVQALNTTWYRRRRSCAPHPQGPFMWVLLENFISAMPLQRVEIASSSRSNAMDQVEAAGCVHRSTCTDTYLVVSHIRMTLTRVSTRL